MTFVSSLVDQGYKINCYDRCVLNLPGPTAGSDTQGVILVEMDDTIDAGNDEHERRMADLASRFTFGKEKILMNEKEVLTLQVAVGGSCWTTQLCVFNRRVCQITHGACAVDNSEACQARHSSRC